MKEIIYTIKLKCKQQKSFRVAINVFFVFCIIALFAPFLANDKPLVCSYKSNLLFPAFSLKSNFLISKTEILQNNSGKDWKLLTYDFSIFSLCAYSPNSIDADNAPRKSPFDKQFLTLNNNNKISLPFKFRHWLGTTQNGNDVLACVIHGFKTAMGVGFGSMFMAAFLGILFGALAGYFENAGFKMAFFQIIFCVIGFVLAWFYSFTVKNQVWYNAFNNGGFELLGNLFISVITFIFILLFFNTIGKKIDELFKIKKIIAFPFDIIISKAIETLNSIPSLLLIIAISALAKPSITLLILIIGFLSWPLIARITRAEYLKAKQLDYVTSAKAIGMSHVRIMFKQILPNCIPILLVQLIFGMAGAVIAEASLSFIGIGVPLNTPTWGSLLNEGRDYFSAWWLVVFPGLSVFGLVFIYNSIATHITTKNETLF